MKILDIVSSDVRFPTSLENLGTDAVHVDCDYSATYVEIIREKIFLNYNKEVPYSCEVEIEEFEETKDILRIRAIIYVERHSQKGIVIGKSGANLKKVGIESRVDIETFFQKKVHLETYVKVEKDWRKKERSLKKFGYQG